MASMNDAFNSPPSSPLSSLDSIPSSPLSIRSRSPTPPYDYPSPSSSNSRASSKDRAMRFSLEPPAKRQKITSASGRTTDFLNLNCLDEDPNSDDGLNLQRLLHTLRRKKKIVVIAGAGISVSAGIPDFRSDTGLFKTLRGQHNLKSSGKDLFDASVYKDDSATASFHDMVREMSHATRAAEPTPFHHMLATIAAEGRLLRLYTQNVDGIDTRLEPLATAIPLEEKGPWPKTIQLHGGLDKMVCSKCGELSDFKADLFEGTETPPCSACEGMEMAREACGKRSHGIGRLRPRMVLYNEYNPDQDAIGAVTTADLKSRPDAVIVVGTSLKIPGVKRMASEMCKVARGRKDGFTAWINNCDEPSGPEFQDYWDLVVKGDSDEVARHAAIPQWNDKDIGEYVDVTGKKLQKGVIKIELEGKAVAEAKRMLTPSSSPRKGTPVPVVIEKSKTKTQRQTTLFEDKKATVTKPRTALPFKTTKVVAPEPEKRFSVKRKASTASILPPPKKTTAPAASKKAIGRPPAKKAPTKKCAPAAKCTTSITNTITKAFTSTKSTTIASGKPVKKVETPILPPTKEIVTHKSALPKLSVFKSRTENKETLRPVRQREVRNNSIFRVPHMAEHMTPSSAQCTNNSKQFEVPESPLEDVDIGPVGRRLDSSFASQNSLEWSPSAQIRRESGTTISPMGSLPSGIAHLIDAQGSR